MDLKSVIKKPLISEKAMHLSDFNRYVFLVDRRANKNQIKEAVRRFFKVEPVKIWTLKIGSEKRRLLGRNRSITRLPFKKAVVALKKGQKLDFYENPKEEPPIQPKKTKNNSGKLKKNKKNKKEKK